MLSGITVVRSLLLRSDLEGVFLMERLGELVVYGFRNILLRLNWLGGVNDGVLRRLLERLKILLERLNVLALGRALIEGRGGVFGVILAIAVEG